MPGKQLVDSAGSSIASAVTFTPAGTIAATNVQAAIEEVVTDLGSIGASSFRGTWATGIAYKAGDLILAPLSTSPNVGAGNNELAVCAVDHTSAAAYDRSKWSQFPPGRSQPRAARDRWKTTGKILSTRFDNQVHLDSIFQSTTGWSIVTDTGGRSALQLTATGTRTDLRTKQFFGESWDFLLRWRPSVAAFQDYHPNLTFGTDSQNEWALTQNSASGNPNISVGVTFKNATVSGISTVTTMPATASLADTDYLTRWSKRGNLMLLKQWKASDAEPDWQVVQQVGSQTSVPEVPQWGYLGFYSQFSKAYLLEATFAEIQRDNADGNLIWNSDFHYTNYKNGVSSNGYSGTDERKIGNPCWWIPGSATGHDLATVTDRFGRTRVALHCSLSTSVGYWAQWVHALMGGGRSSWGDPGVMRNFPYCEELPPVVEVSIWSKATSLVSSVPGNTSRLGLCVDTYYYDRLATVLNNGQPDYYPSLGPMGTDARGAGAYGEGTWDWQRLTWRVHLQNFERLKFLKFQILTHENMTGDFWLLDPAIRMVGDYPGA